MPQHRARVAQVGVHHRDPVAVREQRPDDPRHVRRGLDEPPGRLAPGRGIILAAEEVIVDPGDIRPARIDIPGTRLRVLICLITPDLMDVTSADAYP